MSKYNNIGIGKKVFFPVQPTKFFTFGPNMGFLWLEKIPPEAGPL
jgi:hypothetical protein